MPPAQGRVRVFSAQAQDAPSGPAASPGSPGMRRILPYPVSLLHPWDYVVLLQGYERQMQQLPGANTPYSSPDARTCYARTHSEAYCNVSQSIASMLPCRLVQWECFPFLFDLFTCCKLLDVATYVLTYFILRHRTVETGRPHSRQLDLPPEPLLYRPARCRVLLRRFCRRRRPLRYLKLPKVAKLKISHL